MLLVVACGNGIESESSGGGQVADAETEAISALWVPRIDPPESKALRLPLLAQERSCASGQRADGRVRSTVEETAEAVTITVAVVPLGGVQTCQGNPLTPFEVTLESPLGDRRLVDGATGAPPALDEFVWEPVLNAQPKQLPADAVVSVQAVRAQFWVKLRCELPGSEESFVDEWAPQVEFAQAEDVLAAAIAEMGVPASGFQGFEVLGDEAGGRALYAQYLDGHPVTTIFVDRGTVGWRGVGIVCSDLPPGWSPDSEGPSSEPAAAVETVPIPAELAEILDTIDGLHREGERWEFRDASHRCSPWVALEDSLEAVGWLITRSVKTADWPTQLGEGPLALRRQVEISVQRESERAIIATSGPGALELRASLISPGGEPGERDSSLRQCLLDRELQARVGP